MALSTGMRPVRRLSFKQSSAQAAKQPAVQAKRSTDLLRRVRTKTSAGGQQSPGKGQLALRTTASPASTESPQRSASHSQCSSAIVGAASSLRPRAVHAQQRQKCFQSSPDGSTEQQEVHVERRDLFHQSGGVERRTQCRDERVKTLPNGKTMVVETVTVQKITYLP
mmetsp:Transcript_77056/g.225989  ORF Transcript_77056/g.225989 Transcript_77056/m.225989 type:complete len:167 (-) Transcript_77056:56-556(-)